MEEGTYAPAHNKRAGDYLNDKNARYGISSKKIHYVTVARAYRAHASRGSWSIYRYAMDGSGRRTGKQLPVRLWGN